jgi:hypothetical protein
MSLRSHVDLVEAAQQYRPKFRTHRVMPSSASSYSEDVADRNTADTQTVLGSREYSQKSMTYGEDVADRNRRYADPAAPDRCAVGVYKLRQMSPYSHASVYGLQRASSSMRQHSRSPVRSRAASPLSGRSSLRNAPLTCTTDQTTDEYSLEGSPEKTTSTTTTIATTTTAPPRSKSAVDNSSPSIKSVTSLKSFQASKRSLTPDPVSTLPKPSSSPDRDSRTSLGNVYKTSATCQ